MPHREGVPPFWASCLHFSTPCPSSAISCLRWGNHTYRGVGVGRHSLALPQSHSICTQRNHPCQLKCVINHINVLMSLMPLPNTIPHTRVCDHCTHMQTPALFWPELQDSLFLKKEQNWRWVLLLGSGFLFFYFNESPLRLEKHENSLLDQNKQSLFLYHFIFSPWSKATETCNARDYVFKAVATDSRYCRTVMNSTTCK